MRERGTICGMPGARTPEEATRMYDEQYWHPEQPAPRRREWWKSLWYEIVIALLFISALAALVGFLLWCMISDARGSDLLMPVRGVAIETVDLNRFGTYSDEYYARRWKRMCRGPARYDAMREADERRKPNPCG